MSNGEGNTMYVGRIVAVGRTRGGANVALYRVSSRSFPNRWAIEQQGRVSIVPREGHERDVQTNPYIAYHCLRIVRDWAIVANGSHTDPIAEKIEAGTPVRDALSASLLTLDYEKDAHQTPRIAGAVPLSGDIAWLGIVRHDALVVKAVPLEAGRVRWLATYEANDVRDEQQADFDAADARAAAVFALAGGQFGTLTDPITTAAIKAIATTLVTAWQQYIPIDPECLQVLQTLHSRYTLGLISNFDHPPHVHQVLDDHGLHQWFAVIVISGEVGVQKPHPQIFRVALEQTGLAPADVVYVGDTADDVQGARAAGIHPILIRREHQRLQAVDFQMHSGDTDTAAPGRVPEAVETIARLSELLVRLETQQRP